jgi:ethanolamine ammonia-lyase small subunit
MIQNIVSSIQPALQATGSNASVQVIISDGLSQHNVT